MRCIIQRVTSASVEIDGEIYSTIKNGILILLGIENSDTFEDSAWLCSKVSKLRIFNDDHGVMNLSVNKIEGELLVVSQFTLHASTKKGNRPSYLRAAPPEIAIPIYEGFIKLLIKETGAKVKTGKFGASMKVSLINDGPVTIIIDTKNKE